MQPILSDKKALDAEFEERQGRRGDETVMAYGALAPAWMPKLQGHINMLGKIINLDLSIEKPCTTAEPILDFIKEVQKLTGESDSNFNIVAEEIRKSFSGCTYYGNRLPDYKNQNVHLVQVSRNLIQLLEKYKGNEKVANLASSYFHSLIDQQGRCNRGMMGRMLCLEKAIFDMLVEAHQKTPTSCVG